MVPPPPDKPQTEIQTANGWITGCSINANKVTDPKTKSNRRDDNRMATAEDGYGCIKGVACGYQVEDVDGNGYSGRWQYSSSSNDTNIITNLLAV